MSCLCKVVFPHRFEQQDVFKSRWGREGFAGIGALYLCQVKLLLLDMCFKFRLNKVYYIEFLIIIGKILASCQFLAHFVLKY